MMDRTAVAREIVKIAKSLIATPEDQFTKQVGLRLKKEGATRDSLANARLIQEAGYEVSGTVYDYNIVKGDWKLHVEFVRSSDGHRSSHLFKGFSFGYSGEGSRGLVEFSQIFGLGLNPDKILTHGGSGLAEKGTVPLVVFR